MCKYFPEITSSWNSVFSYKDYSEFVTFIPMQIILNGLSKEESETTEQLHFHFSLSCIRERNGNPLQCCCLENPRYGGPWWAAIYVVAQSQHN